MIEAAKAPPSLATPAVPAALQAVRVIGAFRFHYDTAGANAPAMLDDLGGRIPGTHEEYVESAGSIFNAVLAHQTSVLGYASPIQPDQSAYDVTITDAAPYYGWTEPGARIGLTTPARYRSTVVVDQDYQGFYSPGLDGLRVTAAHEFFHAVQFGSYGYWAGDEYFMELTSTWMEDVIFDGVNDYYQYIRGPAVSGRYTPRGHFAHPDSSFASSGNLVEYSRAIFGKFIEKEYSPDVIRRAWEMMPDGPAITALADALAERGSSFREAFLAWSVWNSKTGPDADTATYYTEGREYPAIVTAPVIEYTPPSRTIAGSIGTVSASYHPVNVRGTPMAVIVANIALPGRPARVGFRYEMADAGDDSFKKLSNGLFVRLDVPDPANWATIETAPAVVAEVTPAPNPYDGEGLRPLRFQIPSGSRPGAVRLTVLGVSMERMYDGPIALRDDLSTPFVQVAEWRPRDRYDRPLPSGVYLYVLDVDGAQHTGKFSVVR